MAYKVVITPVAKRHLEMYIQYTLETLGNRAAARSIMNDAKGTKKRLSDIAGSLALCSNKTLAKHGYRRIFFAKHKFFMVYRVEENIAIVEAMYHELQDYEALFSQKMQL